MGRLTLFLKSYFIKLWKFIKIGCVEVFYIQFSKLERKKNNQNVQEKFLSSMLIPDMPLCSFISIRILCFECIAGV